MDGKKDYYIPQVTETEHGYSSAESEFPSDVCSAMEKALNKQMTVVTPSRSREAKKKVIGMCGESKNAKVHSAIPPVAASEHGTSSAETEVPSDDDHIGMEKALNTQESVVIPRRKAKTKVIGMCAGVRQSARLRGQKVVENPIIASPVKENEINQEKTVVDFHPEPSDFTIHLRSLNQITTQEKVNRWLVNMEKSSMLWMSRMPIPTSTSNTRPLPLATSRPKIVKVKKPSSSEDSLLTI